MQLPADYLRTPVQSTKGAVKKFNIEKELSDQLQELSKSQGTTIFMTLLTVFKVLLFRYTGQSDICVGTGLAGRQHKELEGMIGCFVNLMALRSEVNRDVLFTELLQQVRSGAMEAFQYQDLPFEDVVDAVIGQRDISRSPDISGFICNAKHPRSASIIIRGPGVGGRTV